MTIAAMKRMNPDTFNPNIGALPEWDMKKMIVKGQAETEELEDGRILRLYYGDWCQIPETWESEQWPSEDDAWGSEYLVYRMSFGTWHAAEWKSCFDAEFDKHAARMEAYAATIYAVKKGAYETEQGVKVTLRPGVSLMSGSKLYRQELHFDAPEHLYDTEITVVEEDSLVAAEKLVRGGQEKVAVLNMANRRTPGGGVYHGAGAQEESCFRRSDYFLSLYQYADFADQYGIIPRPSAGSASYPMDRDFGGCFSPDVTVFRGTETEGYPFIEDPWKVNFIAVAAMNRPELVTNDAGEKEIAPSMVPGTLNKIRTIFNIAIDNGMEVLVLGAFGCGAFRNPPEHMARLFARVLEEPAYHGRFKKIVFAILGRWETECHNYRVFRDQFRSAPGRLSARREGDNEMKEGEKYLDAIRGSMLGGAAGDALGYPVEFMLYSEIQRTYGDSGIRSYSYNPVSGKAVISDDTQMSLFTAVGILNGAARARLQGIGETPGESVWNSYQAWLRTQRHIKKSPDDQTKTWLDRIPELYVRRAPGSTCLSALYGGIPGTVEAPVNNSKGCGGVMRVAPVGLYYSGANLSDTDREGAAAAALTHGHPLGYIPAAILTHIVNQITYARDRYTGLREIVLSAGDAAAELFSGNEYIGVQTELIDLAVTLSENEKPDWENIRRLGEGWVAEETLAIAIYCSLRHSDDFSEGIISAVNHDGDSDSTGAVTGNILGAWLGYSAIPDKWKENLELSEVILEVADDLCHGSQTDEYSLAHDPVWKAKYVSRDYNPDITHGQGIEKL